MLAARFLCLHWLIRAGYYTDKARRKSSGTASSLLKSSSSSSDHLSLQRTQRSDVVNNSVCSDQTSAEPHGHRVEVSHTQLVKQLAATSATLRLRTLGFEAMTVLVKHLAEEVVGWCIYIYIYIV